MTISAFIQEHISSHNWQAGDVANTKIHEESWPTTVYTYSGPQVLKRFSRYEFFSSELFSSDFWSSDGQMERAA